MTEITGPTIPCPLKPTYYDTLHEYEARLEAIPDPTTLIVTVVRILDAARRSARTGRTITLVSANAK